MDLHNYRTQFKRIFKGAELLLGLRLKLPLVDPSESLILHLEARLHAEVVVVYKCFNVDWFLSWQFIRWRADRLRERIVRLSNINGLPVGSFAINNEDIRRNFIEWLLRLDARAVEIALVQHFFREERCVVATQCLTLVDELAFY